MSNKVIINKDQCQLIAKKIKPLQFRANHFNRPFLSFSATPEIKLRAYIFSTAICHQTHSLINKRKNLKGWSVLEDVFTILGEQNSQLLDLQYLHTLSPKQLSEKLKPFFAEDGNPDHCTLDRLEERSNFILQIAKTLLEKYDGQTENLLKKSNGYLNGENGLYNLLADFDAYKDPLRKKSMVFIQLADNAKILNIKDRQNITPVMDYHMQRLLLRTGCIEIIDEKLKLALQTKQTLDSDEDVRTASVGAVKIIAQEADKNFFELDEILWSIGRSCCKEKTLCTDKSCNKNPCTFFSFVELDGHDDCIFTDICKGSYDESYRLYWQPMVDTTFY